MTAPAATMGVIENVWQKRTKVAPVTLFMTMLSEDLVPVAN
jgi:hypothetical protein